MIEKSVQTVDLNENLLLRGDVTQEEIFFIELVKNRMLRMLSDRKKFLFLFCFELGRSQRDAASILGLHETNISRALEEIRKTLTPFK